MIKLITDKSTRVITNADAANGNYGISGDERIVEVRITGTKQIPDFAFMALHDLERVIIGEGVERIGKFSFGNATALKSIAFPSTLRSIEYNSFEGCLQQLVDSFPEDVKELLAKAKAVKEVADQKTLEQKAMALQNVETQKMIWDLMMTMVKQDEQKRAEDRKQEEINRAEGDLPRNAEEELLLRVFGDDDLSLYEARDAKDPYLYKFDIGPGFWHDLFVTISIRLASPNTRRKHQISISWSESTYDVWDFDGCYLESVEGMTENLKAIGMKANLKSYTHDHDDDCIYELQLTASKKVGRKELEDFLQKLERAVNDDDLCFKCTEDCFLEKYFPEISDKEDEEDEDW